MFEKSRRKIVATIMSILVGIWIGTLSIIYSSSYFEVSKQNKQMLQTHADMYVLPQSFEKSVHQDIPIPSANPNIAHNFDKQSPMFQLSTFYSVAVSYGGEILEIKNEPPTLHTDDELKILAQNIINSNKINGTKDNLAFYKTDKNGYILVAFMDNTIFNESAETLFRYTLIFGGAALVLFFFISVFLAKKIVHPLEESYKKQKQFISDAGHELKTPVSVVNANAELLSREIGDNQWLQNIQYENERMSILVGQLLDLAKTENVTVQTEQIDFSRLVAGEVLAFESVAFEKGIIIDSNITKGIDVKGNSAQLKQLVSILLDNAIRHSKEQGEIHLSLTKQHNFAILSVINKGDEIPQKQREQIFERFFRIDTARNGDDKHYGLGLAIAKAIVSSHKGNINVQCFNGLVEFKIQIPTI